MGNNLIPFPAAGITALIIILLIETLNKFSKFMFFRTVKKT